MTRFFVPAFFVLAAAAVPSTAALAGDGTAFPALEGTLDIETSNDGFFNSGDPDNELNDLSFDATLGLKLSLTPVFSINSDIVLEPVVDPDGGKDRVFGDLGLYAETLYLQADFGTNGVIAGKIDPSFGRAWDDAPGAYGTDLAEDYQLTEMWGVGAWHKFTTAGAGTHTLTANVFYADTTFLSESLFTNRGRNTTAAGGAANTGRLNSFSITLDGADMPALAGFTYNLGFRHLAAGTGDVADENGFVAGFTQELPIGHDMKLQTLGEFVYLSHAYATADDAVYATSGFKLEKGPWHGELSGTLRNTRFAGGGSRDDYLAQVSGGYAFENGFDVSLGYEIARDAGVTTHAVGLRLTKSFDFALRK